jgi:hypothetical protein|tara:strand:- start:2901 stop:3254 length:354 start_codon:yes stop_codon:yes gene_type:complete
MPGFAGEVEVVRTIFKQSRTTWRVDRTLRHADTGWEHYANAWRIVDDAGTVLGTRELAHPHVDEQPFTRSLQDVVIPQDLNIVFIEARDNKHGWSSKRLRVNLQVPKGRGYEIHHDE